MVGGVAVSGIPCEQVRLGASARQDRPFRTSRAHESPMSKTLALPKSAESGNLGLSKVGVRWMLD
jgi:hypothetical protein